MRAISIAEYLDRAGRPTPASRDAPGSDAEASSGRSAAKADSRPTSALLYVARKIAPPTSEQQTDVATQRRSESGAERQKHEPPASRDAGISKDTEARISEAYERGLQDGRSSAAAAASEAAARDLAARTEQANAERLAFQRDEYASLAREIAAGLVAVEDRISASVARILGPVLEISRTEKVVGELRDAIARLSGAGSPAVMKIRGPENLLAKLREALAGVAVNVEFSEEPTADVTVETGATCITTQLQAWKDLLTACLE